MKRDPALADLSRDHHQALFQAMRLTKATPEELDSVREGVLELWQGHGAEHFRQEEEILLPIYARHADPGAEEVASVLVDHVWIRERMERLERDELALDQVHGLGQRLHDHVRHEERVLFPLIEAALPADELEELRRRLVEADAPRKGS